MKRTDIERMISLADDRYIDEIFQDKITGRRRNIFVTFTAVAAALALVAGGISYFVSTADRERDITIDTPAISMDDNVIVNETTVIAERPVDYSELFKNKYDGEYPLYFNVYAESEFKNESTSAFEMDYAVSILPFKADGYTDKRSQFYVYLDENGDAFGATVYLESEFDENASPKFKCININFGKDGRLSHNFPIEETVPVKRFGADVYCFDDTAAYTSDAYQSNLKAYFAVGDTEYAVETCNISAAETGEIIDSIIQSGFSANSFDMSKAYGFEHETTNINFDTANSTAPFAGYVPVVDSILYLYQKGVIYDVQRVNGNVSGQYMSVVYTDTTDDGDRIMLEYYTSGYSGKEPFEKTVSLQSSSYEFINTCTENGEYKFTLDCGKFMINVTAKCPIEKLWAYINAIKNVRATTGVMAHSSRIITLAEANKIPPYEGYVPQNETAGDMKLGVVQYNGSNIVLDYSFNSENRFSYIGLTYTADKRMTENYAIITLEQLDEGDIVFRRDDDNRSNINFAVDCGSFYVCVDGEKCTAAELYDCIITTLLERSRHLPVSEDVTLAEAKDIEPFGVYVPARESGVLKPEKGILNYHNENGIKEPLSLHFTFSDSDSGDSLVLAYQKDTVDFSAMPAENIIPIENIDWSTVNNFVENNTTFLLDCGEVKILVSPECLVSPENYVGQVWYYIEQIKSAAMFCAAERDGKLITLDKVKELAKKGDDLTWSDFEDYYGVDVGSGLYIMYYAVEGTDYSVSVGGGSPYEKPMYIHFGKGDGNYIDLRYDSVDEFLGEKVPLYAVDSENGNLLTIEKVKELAKKGEDLTWSDFEEFSGVDVGSGMYIMVYPVEDTDYRVTVGGSPDRKPMYIHFGKGDGNYIDLRKDSIDEFLS